MKQEEDINAELIKKVLSGQATLEERKKLSETEAIKHFMRKQWNENSDESISEETGEKIWKQISKRCHAKKQHRFSEKVLSIYAACASVLLLIGSLWFAWNNDGSSEKEYENFYADNHCTLNLPDQSKVWMQPGSTLRYAKKFKEDRKVWLKGDATFEVVKQTEHPFRVYINDAFVEVKGTIFRVMDRDKNLSKVTLFSGRVNFHPLRGNTVSMKPNQSITYSAGKVMLQDIGNIGWQNGLYKFNDIRLDSLVNIVSNLYNVNIELSQDVSSHHQFTGTIRYDELPSEVVEKICYNMNLKYKREHNKLIIYKPNK